MTGIITETIGVVRTVKKGIRKVRRRYNDIRRSYKKAQKMLKMLAPKMPEADRKQFEKYLKRAFVYIRMSDGGYLRLYYDGSLADECGYYYDMTWLNGRAVSVNLEGEPYVMPFARNADGTVKKWKYTDEGDFVEVRRRHAIADNF